MLVTKDWVLKVSDMGMNGLLNFIHSSSGLARFDTPISHETMGKLVGTYAYLAPEIFFGEKYAAKADVFSLGIILWEISNRIVTGESHSSSLHSTPLGNYKFPYSEYPDMQQEVVIAIKVAEQGRRPTNHPLSPPPWTQLVKKTLQHNPQDRPSAAEMLKDLEGMLEDYKKDPQKWEASCQQ